MVSKYLIIFSIICVFFLSWKYFKKEELSITNYPSNGVGVVAFGDSLISGVGSIQTEGFIKILEDDLNIEIVNQGKPGDTTGDARMRLKKTIEEIPHPKVVIILLGGNDYLRRVPEEETFTNLGIIIETFQKTGAVVLLLGVQGGIITDHFEGRFEEIADRYKVAFVLNVLEGVLGNQTYMSDSVHPNNTGYKIIANRVAPSLKKIIE